jgi:hypothetical protein
MGRLVGHAGRQDIAVEKVGSVAPERLQSYLQQVEQHVTTESSSTFQ